MMVGSVRCLTTRCWRVVAACVSLAGVVAGCTSSPIPLEMAPGADAYVVAVRDDVAMVVAVKVSEARVVPTTRLAGDGQEIIQSELVGGDAESSVLAVVRRNAATDIIRVSEAGSRTEVLKAGLNTGLVASDGVHVAWLTPAAGGAGHQLHLASGSWEGVADLDFAPTHLDVGDGTVVSASSESGNCVPSGVTVNCGWCPRRAGARLGRSSLRLRPRPAWWSRVRPTRWGRQVQTVHHST
jgi:hypothetical protein